MQPCRQHYRCKACAGRSDNLTGTVLAGHHQPLRVWVLCLCFMGLNTRYPPGTRRVLQVRVAVLDRRLALGSQAIRLAA